MKIKFSPFTPNGDVTVPSSKSYAHRALLLAAQCNEPTELILSRPGEDIRRTAAALALFGADCRETADGFRVLPGQAVPAQEVNCGESGSTLRLSLPLAALIGKGVRFTGEGRLPERPIGELCRILAEKGCAFSDMRLPFTVSGSLRSGLFRVEGGESTQFVSALMMALPLLKGESRIETELCSGYLDLTEETVSAFGGTLIKEKYGYSSPGGGHYRSPGRLTVPGDDSAAAFFEAAGALGRVRIGGIAENSRQPDALFRTLLTRMGVNTAWDEQLFSVQKGALRGIDADLTQAPDIVPLFAALAALGEGETNIRYPARLKDKESDRLAGTLKMLSAVGCICSEHDGVITVRGGICRGGVVDAQNDHRLVMAAALLGAAIPLVAEHAGGIEKSYPAFWEDYQAIGGKIWLL